MLYLLKIRDHNPEPFLIQEAVDAVVKTARESGFSHKKVIDAADQKTLDQALFDYHSPSLFTQEKTIFIFKMTQKTAEKLASSLNLLKNLKIIYISSVSVKQFPRWLEKYFAKSGFILEPPVRQLVCDHAEGNLWAAQQCLEKLKLFYPPEELKKAKILTQAEILEILIPSAKYTVFDLINALSPDQTQKAAIILSALSEEGIEPAIVLWALARETRRRKREDVLPALVNADQIIKHIQTGNVWEALLHAAFLIMGKKLL